MWSQIVRRSYSAGVSQPPDAAARPQSLLLIYFGDFVVESGGLVASSSVLDLLGAAGVGEAAARATLSRMTRRGLLRRATHGRRAWFGLSDAGRPEVLEGRARFRDADPAPDAWDGAWTVVAFSMPEAWQRERHDLRNRLTWAGFGPAQAGLWVAPRRVDIVAVVAGLGVEEHLRVFEGAPAGPTDAARLAAEAWDLDAVAARYDGFLERWADGGPVTGSALARYVMLGADWLQVVRKDPRLPADFLPDGWPAVRSRARFRGLLDDLTAPATAEFAERAEVIPDPG